MPGILLTLCLLYSGLMEELPLGLADVMQRTGCDDDLGKVVGDLEAGNEGAPAGFEVPKGALH